jgi:hypothetical protein
MARVLNTPELLDLVLSRLDVKDLLTAEAVNKRFHAMVHSSHGARETLFLRIRPTLQVKWFTLRRPRTQQDAYGMLDNPPPVYTIELQSAVEIFKDLDGHEVEELDHLAELCPWLEPIPMSLPADRFVDLQDSWQHGLHDSGPVLCAQLWREPLEGTLFADVLLTSPPCYSVFMHVEYKQEDGTSLCADRWIRENSALTMGSVLQAARKMRGRVWGERLVDSAGHERQRKECQFKNTSLDAELANSRLRGE